MKPLAGLRILVTRPRGQAEQLAAPLRRLGARVLVRPMIAIRPPGSWARVDREILRLSRYDALVFTSVNAVAAFWGRLPRGAAVPDTGAIGPATAAALRARGVRPAWVANRFTAAALGRMLRGRVLHPTSDPHSPDLAREARRRGAVVVEPIVYRIGSPGKGGRIPPVDLVTFASAQTVRNFVAAVESPRGLRCACIGPVTARAARAAGFRVVARPRRYTIPDLVGAIVAWKRKSRRS
jgi:uroporphyrinogen III methyltransferase/synthase